jgi:hypothetical protein
LIIGRVSSPKTTPIVVFLLLVRGRLDLVPDPVQLDLERLLHRVDGTDELERMRGLAPRLQGQAIGREGLLDGIEIGRVGAILGRQLRAVDRPGGVGLGERRLPADLDGDVTTLMGVAGAEHHRIRAMGPRGPGERNVGIDGP